MKHFLLTCLLVSGTALAIDPHDGGGGTICVPKGRFSFKSLDEIFFGNFRGGSTKLGPKLSDVADARVQGLRSADLLASPVGRSALEKISALETLNPGVTHLLLNSLRSLSDVYVIGSKFGREFGAPSSQRLDDCIPETVRSVIVTDSMGQTVVSKPDWENLSDETQEILLIHEAIRIAPFLNVTWQIDELQIYELTMLIWKKDLHTLATNVVFMEALHEVRTADFDLLEKLKIDLNKSLGLSLNNNNAQAAFLVAARSNEFRLQSSEAPVLNDPYQWYISQNILDLKKNEAYFKLLSDGTYWEQF